MYSAGRSNGRVYAARRSQRLFVIELHCGTKWGARLSITIDSCTVARGQAISNPSGKANNPKAHSEGAKQLTLWAPGRAPSREGHSCAQLYPQHSGLEVEPAILGGLSATLPLSVR